MTTQTAPDYLSTAFYSQYNLILLGGSALFSLASASPVPLALGAAAELLWLGVGPRLPVFRKRVEERVDAERRARLDDEVMTGMRTLAPDHTTRLLAVGQAISWLTLNAERKAADAADRALLAELEELRPVFMRLCQLHERIVTRLSELRQDPPEHEVARLSQAYAAEKDLGLRFTLHQSIKLAQKKIEQQSRLVDVQRQAEMKLSLLEQSLAHLRSQQQLGVAWPDFVRELQGVLVQSGSAASLEAEMTEL
jgi:hypothetical protein